MNIQKRKEYFEKLNKLPNDLRIKIKKIRGQINKLRAELIIQHIEDGTITEEQRIIAEELLDKVGDRL